MLRAGFARKGLAEVVESILASASSFSLGFLHSAACDWSLLVAVGSGQLCDGFGESHGRQFFVSSREDAGGLRRNCCRLSTGVRGHSGHLLLSGLRISDCFDKKL